MNKFNKKTDVVNFGKFKGKTISQIIREEPSYILWMHENNVAEIHEDIVIDAEEEVESRRPPIRRNTYGTGYMRQD